MFECRVGGMLIYFRYSFHFYFLTEVIEFSYSFLLLLSFLCFDGSNRIQFVF